MKRTEIEKIAKENVFEQIGKKWMLVTAGTKEKNNTMTASWGGLGWLWNKPVAFVFIRPERYTHGFIEQSDRLTLSFYPENLRKALQLCGSKSGRDTDKVAETGLTPCVIETGAVTFAEAEITLDCRKIFKTSMQTDNFIDKEILNCWYNDKPGGSLHDVYVVEIESVYEK